MKEKRRNAETGVRPAGTDPVGETPGKRSLILESIEHFAPTAVGGDGVTSLGGDGDNNAARGDNNVENPLGGQQAQQNTAKTKTTVSFKETAAPPLTFHGKDYRELYGAVSAHVGKEAGSVTRTPSIDTTDDGTNVLTAKISYELATMLPEWPEKGSQPAADQAKFNAWRTSVSDHEKGHRDLYKRDLAKVTTQVIGPTKADVDTQEDAVEAAAETNQDAYDKSTQPAPLAAPGGIEKVGADGSRTSDASDGGTPGDGGTALA